MGENSVLRACSLVAILTFTCTNASLGQSLCGRKLLATSDLAGILSEPLVGQKDVVGDPQTCRFVTASFPSITVTVRPGLGQQVVTEWAAGHRPFPATPIQGVGDHAVWVAISKEVIADKNNVLCDAKVVGADRDLANGVSDPVLQKRLGDACNKIFKALPAQPK